MFDPISIVLYHIGTILHHKSFRRGANLGVFFEVPSQVFWRTPSLWRQPIDNRRRNNLVSLITLAVSLYCWWLIELPGRPYCVEINPTALPFVTMTHSAYTHREMLFLSRLERCLDEKIHMCIKHIEQHSVMWGLSDPSLVDWRPE